MKKGKQFESASLKVVKKLHPTQKVLGNVKVVGKFTQYPREIDIKLIDPNQYDFVAFECKDHKAKIDVEYLEAFITKLQDIGAKKGAVVSNSGFTTSAIKIAKAFNVDTLTLVDSENKIIKTKIYAGLIMEVIYVGSLSIEFTSSTIKHFSINPNLYSLSIRDSQNRQGTTYEIFAWLWNLYNTPLSHKPGTYSYTLLKELSIELLTTQGTWIDLDSFEFTYEVKKRYYQGKIEMIDTCGLYDVHNETYQTKSMTTEKITPLEIAKNWPEISPEELEKRANEFGMRLTVVSEMPESYLEE